MGNKFQPGDRVRTVSTPNYTPLRGAGLEYTIKVATDYKSIPWGVLYELEGVTFGAYEIGLELIEDTLEDLQAKAKAELDRINALILERDSPKVGDRFCNSTMTQVFTVLDVYRGRVFGRRENRLEPLLGPCQAASHPLDEFKGFWFKSQ